MGKRKKGKSINPIIIVAIIGAIGSIITALVGILPSMSKEHPSSTPTPALHPPQLYGKQLWYTVNGSEEKSVMQQGTINVGEDDTLCLLRFEFSTEDIPTPADIATAEAYIHKPEIPVNPDEGFDKKDGVFWSGSPIISGDNELKEIDTSINNGCWTIGKDWDRLVVALVHNGTFESSEWEVDHRFFVKLQ